MRRRGSRLKNLPHGAFAAALSAALLTLTLLFTAPLAAQETTVEHTTSKTKAKTASVQYEEATEGTKTDSFAQNTPSDDSQQQVQASSETMGGPQPATRAGGPLADGTTRVTDSDDSDLIVNRVVILEEDCTVREGASVLVKDEDGTKVRLTDGENVSITSSEEQVVAQGLQGGNLDGATPISNGSDAKLGVTNRTEAGTVISSKGIACGREDDANVGDDGVRTANDLANLECEELLRRYRNNIVGQYGNPFTNADVEARIAVCLEQEVIDDTDTGDDLPDTGGLPLAGFAVLGLASVAAGVSLIRVVSQGE